MATRLGLFGGTFDPPHVAHLAIAEAAREQARLDRVIWMPAATSPFKRGEDGRPAAHRLEMVRRAISGNRYFEVSDIEVARGGMSYTIDTLRALSSAEPNADLYLLIGGDSLSGFPEWREPEEIVRMARLAVYRREADGADEVLLLPWLAGRVQTIEAPPITLSSTAVREHLRSGRSARYLVPDAVREYIAAHQLYRPVRVTDPPGGGWS